MITYNDIYEASRKERFTDQLQPINPNFITEVSIYLKDKKDIASKEDDVFSDVILKTKKQLENAVTLFKELVLRRRKKILNLVLVAGETGISKQDFDNMLPLEKELFEKLMSCIDCSDKALNELLKGEVEDKQKNSFVVFLDYIEEFVNLQGEKMGPYEAGQVANLPKEIAKILIDDEKAELV
jgi:DNA replication initiation complex subunit (GINS family)